MTPFAVAHIVFVLEGLGARTVAAGLVRPDGLAVGAGITAAGILPPAAGMSASIFALLVFWAVLLLP